MAEQRAVLVIGDGLAWSGRCLLTHILFTPGGGTQYVRVYDGRDATSGKRKFTVTTSATESLSINLGEGVPFDVGIYLDAQAETDETMVVFKPLDE